MHRCTKGYWFWSTSKQLQYFYTVPYEKWYETSEQLTLQLSAKHTNQLHDERISESVNFNFDKNLKILKVNRNTRILVNNMNQWTYLPTYLLTYLFTPWSRVNLVKLTCFQLVKNFPKFYVTRQFITSFKSAANHSISWATSIQSIPPHTNSWRSILILSSHLNFGLPSGFYFSGFGTKICAIFSSLTYALNVPLITKLIKIMTSSCVDGVPPWYCDTAQRVLTANKY